MRLISSAVVCGMITLAAQAHAEPGMEVWRVVEGPQGAFTGIWNVKRDGDKISGNARMMRSGHAPLTYGFSGEVKAGQLIVERVDPSDNARCRYVGTPVADGVMNGTTICGRHGGHGGGHNSNGSVWQVTVASRDPQ